MMNEYGNFERLVQNFDQGNKLIRVWELKGGISAQVTGLEILQSSGRIVKMIVRQHGDNDLKRNPNIAADEHKLLGILKAAGLPVPMPYYFEQSCEIFSKPCILLEFIEGKSEFTPSNLNHHILQLAINLAKIHRVNCADLSLSFLPKVENTYVEMLNNKERVSLDETLNLSTIRDLLKYSIPFPSKNKEVILHGDYWPGNILWKEDKLVSIIDWEDSGLGDPLADLANSQLEISYHFGMQAMNDFTHRYKSMMPELDFTNLPFWQLFAALRLSTFPEWGLEKSKENSWKKRHKSFVRQAINQIRNE
ncbi:aminoglycoside phosphotransferase family protein [Bacillus sp. ISL-4]|uniref:aminoglycoside phosphotransferase family protein n=1 Tax=Bacillus sp. ISL-4 TaxID=2819125 RepID=UPI001BE81819|nr:aminoglycoside phosphotransferase family protein [Bacillus sp. ISL-4]MBT2667676.1 aminoglycoside phosphotransferase family protein [Bacillus sp. ISL-4]MBT2672287.1 aminoglycoside phosphotransferase family protein [Streptomyces sp. ISL-14]